MSNIIEKYEFTEDDNINYIMFFLGYEDDNPWMEVVTAIHEASRDDGSAWTLWVFQAPKYQMDIAKHDLMSDEPLFDTEGYSIACSSLEELLGELEHDFSYEDHDKIAEDITAFFA